MADSLTGRGVIQPLTVVTRQAFLEAHPDHDDALGPAEYVVVDGNRRLEGAKLAGLDDVPVHIDDALAENADTLLETALTAAVQHENLDPLDEAKALQRLIEVHDSQRAVARALGKSSGWVTQRLALLKHTLGLQKAVEDKSLPVEVARRVGQLPEQQQHDAAQEALTERTENKKRRRQLSRGAYAVSTTSPAPGSSEGAKPDTITDASVSPPPVQEKDLPALAEDLRSPPVTPTTLVTPARLTDPLIPRHSSPNSRSAVVSGGGFSGQWLGIRPGLISLVCGCGQAVLVPRCPWVLASGWGSDRYGHRVRPLIATSTPEGRPAVLWWIPAEVSVAAAALVRTVPAAEGRGG
ncbi:ParB/RepB/Spo0J family partition protein [Streptomyces sp. HK10]|uniref:ParB/RepB/Spo0J family partition protein n=1 Tax=Streptomyces sp. HK10 TaxID=3373255 RepID=UPI0037487F9C